MANMSWRNQHGSTGCKTTSGTNDVGESINNVAESLDDITYAIRDLAKCHNDTAETIDHSSKEANDDAERRSDVKPAMTTSPLPLV